MDNTGTPSPAVEPLGYRPADACTLLGIGQTKMKELIRNGQVESIKIGRTRIVTARSVKELLYGKVA